MWHCAPRQFDGLLYVAGGRAARPGARREMPSHAVERCQLSLLHSAAAVRRGSQALAKPKHHRSRTARRYDPALDSWTCLPPLAKPFAGVVALYAPEDDPAGLETDGAFLEA